MSRSSSRPGRNNGRPAFAVCVASAVGVLLLLGTKPAGAQGSKTTTGNLPETGVSTVGFYYRDIVEPGKSTGAKCTKFDSGTRLHAVYRAGTVPLSAKVAGVYCGATATNTWQVSTDGVSGSPFILTATVDPAPTASGTVRTITKLTANGVVVGSRGFRAGWGALGGILDDFRSSASRSSGMADTARFSIDGANVWSMASDALAEAGARYFLDSSDRLMLEDIGGLGTVNYGLGVFLNDGLGSINYSGQASLSNGVFTATGAFATLPWILQTANGRVVRSELSVSHLPAVLYDINVADGDHTYEYDREIGAFASNTVPEPTSLALTGIGLLGIFVPTWYRRRSRGSTSS